MDNVEEVMTLFDTVRMQRDKIYEIAQRHGVENVRVFGSVAREEERPDSDIDFLVHMQDGRSMFDLIRFRREVGSLLHRDVDVISDGGIYHRLRERILNDAKSI